MEMMIPPRARRHQRILVLSLQVILILVLVVDVRPSIYQHLLRRGKRAFHDLSVSLQPLSALCAHAPPPPPPPPPPRVRVRALQLIQKLLATPHLAQAGHFVTPKQRQGPFHEQALLLAIVELALQVVDMLGQVMPALCRERFLPHLPF